MDVSPIQRLAMTANNAAPAVTGPRETTPVVPPAAQVAPAPAEQQTTERSPVSPSALQVIVSWHAASVGYVTKVVDEHSGSVVYQSPPEQILDMVEKLMDRLLGHAA